MSQNKAVALGGIHEGSLSMSPEARPKRHLTLPGENDQRKWDQYVYDSVLQIGIDFLAASNNESFEPEHFENLHSHSMVDFDINEVLRIFDGDWQYVQADLADAHAAKCNEDAAKRRALLQEIAEARKPNDGESTVPTQLFKQVRTETRTVKDKKTSKAIKVAVLTDKDVADEQKIIRYSRFKAAQQLTANLGTNKYRLQTAATGIKFEDAQSIQGSFAHSYLAELQTIMSEEDLDIVRADIENIARVHGWDDFIFPSSRTEHLRKVYDASQQFCIPKGASEQLFSVQDLVKGFSPCLDREKPYYFDVQAELIIKGEVMKRRYLHTGVAPDRLAKLGALLLDKEAIPHSEKHAGQANHWDQQAIARCGRFILHILKRDQEPVSGHVHLSEEIIKRAQLLKLLPTFHRIHSVYGTTREFYKDIGAKAVTTTGAFGAWSEDNYIEYLQGVADGRRPTYRMLVSLHQEDPWSYPSPYVIAQRLCKTNNLSSALERAGFIEIKNWDKQRYERWGVAVMEANEGRQLTTLIIRWLSIKGFGPSKDAIIHKYESIGEFTKRIAKLYEQKQLNGAATLDAESAVDEPWPRTSDLTQLKLDSDFERFYNKNYVMNRENSSRLRKQRSLQVSNVYC